MSISALDFTTFINLSIRWCEDGSDDRLVDAMLLLLLKGFANLDALMVLFFLCLIVSDLWKRAHLVVNQVKRDRVCQFPLRKSHIHIF